MKNVAQFEKVSLKAFSELMIDSYPKYQFTKDEINDLYNNVQIPRRATVGSVGYDFVTPFGFRLFPGSKIKIPTGIRVNIMKDDYALFLMPKSRNAKNSIRISNTIGVVDPDYYFSDNEGHIMIVLEMPPVNHEIGHETKFGEILRRGDIDQYYNSGDGIAQGIFIECGKCIGENDQEYSIRNGGYGSTGN